MIYLITEHATGSPEEKTELFNKLFVERQSDLKEKSSHLLESDSEAYLKVELCGMEYMASNEF